MRIPFIAGNWKMFKTKAEALAFAEEFKELYKDTDVQTAICAPFTNLQTLKDAFAGTQIKVGAQNVHFADEGAFTGEISVGMLEEIGVDFCIVGHSERRQYFAETDETVNKKLKKLFEGPIRSICTLWRVRKYYIFHPLPVLVIVVRPVIFLPVFAENVHSDHGA